jgi:anti-sigma B factor antagonist
MVQVIVEERAPGRFVMSLDGDLDLATAPALADAVAGLLAGARVEQLLVDLAEVRFLDSSGVRALLQARRAATEHGAGFAVGRPGEVVARVLRMAAVDQLLGVDGPTAAPQAEPPSSPSLER